MTYPDVDYPTATDRQTAARDAYRASVAEGAPLTGAELGRRFNRTDRWGRYQITQAQAEDSPTNGHQPPRLPAVRDALEVTPDPTPATRDQAAATPTPGHNGDALLPEPADLVPSTRQTTADEGQPWLDTLITLVVALVAAAASYGHMLEVASWAGEPLWLARAFPITVDGLVLAAIRRGEEGRRWLALGAAVSIAANILAQFPDQAAAAGPIVSAWPPLALYGTHRLLHGNRRRGTHLHRVQP